VPESFEFVSTYVKKLLFRETYKSQTSPRSNAVVYDLVPNEIGKEEARPEGDIMK